LAKLYTNISRYITFAIANQFSLIADYFNEDIYSILHLVNYKYPRGGVPSPGFTAGTCLRKDFGMINETIPYTDMLLSSWKINEYMPKFLVDGLLKRTLFKGKIVAVLGYAFKRNTDDIRDSLVPKLIRYIEREVPHEIRVHDPCLEGIDGNYKNFTLDGAISGADIVYLSIDHSLFIDRKEYILTNVREDCYFIDLWNIMGTNKIFFRKDEVRQ
jgi:UDP-N-acetyl-D-mannosaminuronic acid dehydrogenase